jgi:hypothetical protein
MLRLLPLLLLWALTAPLPWGHQQAVIISTAQTVRAVPINLRDHRFGPLQVMEAWELRSPNSYFGGFSAMTVTPDRQFTLFADTGTVARFRMAADGRVQAVAVAPLAGLETARKGDSDIEAVTVDPATGQLWIAFEVANRIARYSPDAARLERAARPSAMRRWPRNGGAEAMVRMADGRFLILSERANTRRLGTAGILYARDPVSDGKQQHILFGYQAWGMGQLTDAATLPDGRVLLLHRHISPWRWFTSTLAIADADDIADRQSWTARPLASIGQPTLSENFEALAIVPARGGLSIWMLSDDNFNGWQQTILLRLFLPDADLPPR